MSDALRSGLFNEADRLIDTLFDIEKFRCGLHSRNFVFVGYDGSLCSNSGNNGAQRKSPHFGWLASILVGDGHLICAAQFLRYNRQEKCTLNRMIESKANDVCEIRHTFAFEGTALVDLCSSQQTRDRRILWRGPDCSQP
ncbi:hypothetical protein ACQZ42_32375 [Rhizobium rhizogenes]